MQGSVTTWVMELLIRRQWNYDAASPGASTALYTSRIHELIHQCKTVCTIVGAKRVQTCDEWTDVDTDPPRFHCLFSHYCDDYMQAALSLPLGQIGRIIAHLTSGFEQCPVAPRFLSQNC